jgi:CRP-like cAMP-binding protein
MVQEDEIRDSARQAIDQLAPFGDLLNADERQYLVDNGTVRSVVPDERICIHHQLDSRVFILVIGEVAVSEGEGKERFELIRLGPGEIFGEISALFQLPRIADVTATRPSVLLELPGDVLAKVVSGRPELQTRLVQQYKNRVTETALHTIPLFSHLPAERLAQLAEQASLVGIPAGSSIVMQDEPGDSLYVIVYGSAKVTQNSPKGPVIIAKLQGGDFFGERSFLTGELRNATVTALMRVEALRFEFSQLQTFTHDFPEMSEEIARHIKQFHTDPGLSSLAAIHPSGNC